MKKSCYNFLFPRKDGSSILYNSRTGAMAELDREHAEQLNKLSETELEECNPAFAEALLQNGFAVESNVSELNMIRYDSLRARFGSQVLALTILPTIDCNFGCKYCYEKDVLSHLNMDDEIKAALISYIETNIFMGGRLEVCWYGGEPLLALDTIVDISEKILNICKEKQVEYKASIVTNGYLLSKETADILIQCGIDNMQITLDGLEETHNRRRCLKNGEKTYHVIWENILALQKYRDRLHVNLRVNVDKGNREAVEMVKQQISSLNMEDFIYVYPGKVMDMDGCYSKGDCFNQREFAQLELEFDQMHPERLVCKYPKPRPNVCCADCNTALVVTANGDLFKCWKDVGRKDRRIGNLKSDANYNEELLYQYLLFDATQSTTCKKCKYLPICMGGCPHDRANGENGCTLYKYTLEAYLKQLVSLMD